MAVLSSNLHEMIAVVEGVSAAGKTTWCLRHSPALLIPETELSSTPPDASTDPCGWARFWAAHNANRWKLARRTEAAQGTAICDTDPLKLHYAWSLWQNGVLDSDAWKCSIVATRGAVERGQLGFADLFLIRSISPEQVRSQREGDPHRRRRNFEQHLQLMKPHHAWYEALSEVLPGRVRWQYPERLPDDVSKLRPDEQLPAFDRLLAQLS